MLSVFFAGGGGSGDGDARETPKEREKVKRAVVVVVAVVAAVGVGVVVVGTAVVGGLGVSWGVGVVVVGSAGGVESKLRLTGIRTSPTVDWLRHGWWWWLVGTRVSSLGLGAFLAAPSFTQLHANVKCRQTAAAEARIIYSTARVTLVLSCAGLARLLDQAKTARTARLSP